jgi:hypothetical protein
MYEAGRGACLHIPVVTGLLYPNTRDIVPAIGYFDMQKPLLCYDEDSSSIPRARPTAPPFGHPLI